MHVGLLELGRVGDRLLLAPARVDQGAVERQRSDGGDRLHPGERRELLPHGADLGRALLGAPPDDPRREGQHAPGVEAGVGVGQRHEAPDHEPAAHQEHERQRHLGDHHAAPEQRPAGEPGRAARPAEHVGQARARGADGRGEPEERRREQRREGEVA